MSVIIILPFNTHHNVVDIGKILSCTVRIQAIPNTGLHMDAWRLVWFVLPFARWLVCVFLPYFVPSTQIGMLVVFEFTVVCCLLVFVCCLLLACVCLLFAHCLCLFVVCSLLVFVCCLLLACVCLLFVVCCLLFVVCCLLFPVCCLLLTWVCLLFAPCLCLFAVCCLLFTV